MKFGLSDKVIEGIQKVFQTEPKVETVILFGSRAKGNFKPGSDIDLAVKGRHISFNHILSLNVKLDELDLPYKIDLINYSSIKDADVIEHIERVGIIFYSKWRRYKLKDITTKIGSGATPTGGGNNYKLEGISLIRSQNILDLKFSTDGLALIDDEQANALKNVTVQENDVLLNITGDSVARVCKVPKNIIPARVNQHVSIIRADNSKVSSNFLLYYLQAIKPQLLSFSEIGGTRNALTKAMIENIDVLTPPLTEQIVIAGVLSSLDDKIDLLHRQNKTLEQLAETVFRQWFVVGAGEKFKMKFLGDFIDSTLGGEWGKESPEGEYQLQVQCIRGTDIADLETGIPEKTPIRFIKQRKFEKY